MTKKQVTIALVSLLIIASFLRVYNLMPADKTGAFAPPGLYPDEAMNGNNIQEAMDTGNFKIFYPENFGREGLFINIQGASVALFGHSPLALRLPSALFGILTVLGLYFLTRELFANGESGIMNYGNKNPNPNSLFTIHNSEYVALFSSFLLATSFWHINFSRIGFRAIMAPFFLAWGMYFLLKSLNANRSTLSAIRYTLYAILGGIIYGLGFYSYIAYRATPLLIMLAGYLLLRNIKTEERALPLKRFVVFIAFTILTVLPIGIYFVQNPADFLGRTAGISIFNSPTPLQDLALNIVKTLGMFNVVGDFNWRHNFAGLPQLSFGVGILFLFGIYLSIQKIIKEKMSAVPELIITSWFFIVMLPIIVSNEGLPHALRAILLIPAVFIFAGIGGAKTFALLQSHYSQKISRTIVALFCTALFIEVYIMYFMIWANRPEVQDAFAYRDYGIAQQINALPKELIKYIVVNNTQGTIQRDYPISLQAVLFLTDTFSDKKRAEKNIIYLTPEQFKNLKREPGSVVITF